MSAKNEILSYLERHRESYTSGERLARELGVSRAAVWKAVNALKQEGHRVEAVTNKGYRLAPDSDLLSAESIRPWLGPETPCAGLEVFSSLESTNQAAKQRAIAGAPHGTVLLAEGQTMGRGRLGRSFFSPAGCGVYLSVLLRPALSAGEAALLTAAASVAVCRAVAEVGGPSLGIKWVNDLYLDEKKVGGILTEALTDFESGMVEYVVVGVGLNVCPPPGGYPGGLRGTAGAIFDKKPDGALRSRLAGALVNHLFSLCGAARERAYLEEYRARSTLLGREVTVGGRAARAVGIDEQGGLLVRYPDGRMETLRSGEVSARKA